MEEKSTKFSFFTTRSTCASLGFTASERPRHVPEFPSALDLTPYGQFVRTRARAIDLSIPRTVRVVVSSLYIP